MAESVSYAEPTLSVVSGVTGRLAGPGELTDPATGSVRFGTRSGSVMWCRPCAVRVCGLFVEAGPDGALTAMAADSAGEDVALVALLRRDRDEEHTAVSALGRIHARGHAVDWAAFFDGRGGRRVDLPTYAFEHRRYWLDAGSDAGDAAGLGLVPLDHGLLGAAVRRPDSDGLLLTGRLSLRSHPWLADHVVGGVVLLPGTAFVEMAIRAGDEVGAGLLEELVLEVPLVLAEQDAVQVQVVVDQADERGRREVSVHSSPNTDSPWTLHARGVLAPTSVAPSFDLVQWPPAEAEAVDLDGFYAELSGAGLEYGPVFQGVRAVWRRGGEVFAEVALPEGVSAEGFGLHPALLDAALHGLSLARDAGAEPVLPFAWSEVALHAVGATGLRVRLELTAENTVSLRIADATGRPVASAGPLVLRELPAGQLSGPALHDSLFGLDWAPVTVPVPAEAETWAVIGNDGLGLDGSAYPDLAAVAEAGSAPALVLLPCWVDAATSGSPPSDARTVLFRVLTTVQEWLDDSRFEASKLVVVTRGAVAIGEDRVDVTQAPVWGLLRTAELENPGRFVLVDVDVAEACGGLVVAGAHLGEPEFAVRAGVVRVPRLVRRSGSAPRVLDSAGTVLVTGASGALGGLTARHLVIERGVRNLLLVSRRGVEASGMAELVAELEESGASVRVAACDVADRDALAEVIGSIDADRPLVGVVHTAGVLDDGVIGALTPDRMDVVLRPKVDAAWNLHELTRELDLSAFVLFSSVSGCDGECGAGQLRGGEHVPGRAGGTSAKPGTARRLAGVGSVGTHRYDDRGSGRCGPRADGPRRDRGADGRGGAWRCSTPRRPSARRWSYRYGSTWRGCARARCPRCCGVWSADPDGARR